MYLLLETDRVLIRPLELSDAETLLDLFTQLGTRFFRNTPEISNLDDSKKFIEKSIHEISTNSAIHWALIDKSNNQLLGIWHWGKSIPEEAYIYCCISPSYMRMGYMSEVANAMLSRMPEYGLKKATAEVPSSNLEARYFMLHFGWRCVEKCGEGYEKWELNT